MTSLQTYESSYLLNLSIMMHWTSGDRNWFISRFVKREAPIISQSDWLSNHHITGHTALSLTHIPCPVPILALIHNISVECWKGVALKSQTWAEILHFGYLGCLNSYRTTKYIFWKGLMCRNLGTIKIISPRGVIKYHLFCHFIHIRILGRSFLFYMNQSALSS